MLLELEHVPIGYIIYNNIALYQSTPKHKKACTHVHDSWEILYLFIVASNHYDDVIMGAIASQMTSLTIVYSTVYSDADQRKHQSSASLAFVWGIHRGRVNSPHKWPVTRKMFPFDDVIMWCQKQIILWSNTHKILTHSSKCFGWNCDICKKKKNLIILPYYKFSQLVFLVIFYHMMTSSNGKIFRVTDHLCGEFTGPRWIPRTKDSDSELWCCPWSALE